MVNQKKKSFLFGLLGAATAAGMVMGATGVISTFVEKPAEANAAAGDKYVRLNEMPEEGLSGEYLIVCLEKGYIFNGGLSNIDVAKNYITFDASASSLDWNSELSACAFQIEEYQTGYSIKTSNNTYLYFNGGNSNDIATDDAPHLNQISINASGNASISCDGGNLVFNTSGSSNRFRYFVKSSSSSKAIQLYKLEKGESSGEATISCETSSVTLLVGETQSIVVDYSGLTNPLFATTGDPDSVDVKIESSSDVLGTGSVSIELAGKAVAEDPVDITIGSEGANTISLSVVVNPSQAYGKISKLSDLVDGLYVVMAFSDPETHENTKVASFDSSKDRYLAGDAAIDGDNLLAEDPYTFKIEAHSKGYSIFDNTQQMYVGVTFDSDGVDTGKVGLSSNLGEDYYWSISIDQKDGTILASPLSAENKDYYFANNSRYGYIAVYKSGLLPSLYAADLSNVTDEQRLATFGKLYLRADEELTGEYTGACVDDGYYARAKSALEGDWADVLPLLEADTTGLKDRYMAWAIANGELADLSGSKATYYTLNPNASFSKKVTTAALSGLGVLAVGAAATGVMIAIRKKKHE